MEKKKLTTAAGVPVPDNDNAATPRLRSPMLLRDTWYSALPKVRMIY